LINYIFSILFNDLLPSFLQLHDSALIEFLVLISRKLNQVRLKVIIICKSFTIQRVLQTSK
ncbi:hypothetical protein WN55_07891, partial [Dufourea novaeangliae]